MDWVMEHQSPGGVPAQLPTAALSPHASHTQGQHGKPPEEIQLPFVKATEGNEGEGRSNKPSTSLQTRLCSSPHGSFGAFCSLSHNSPGCCTCTMTAHLHHPQDRGSTWAPPGIKLNQQSAHKTSEEPCSETEDMVPVNTR